MREVVDDAGCTWTIYAIVPDAYDDRIGIAPGYHRGWLCFQSAAEKWRFLGIPDRWDMLDDMELLALMDEAIPVTIRIARST
jgi:hypothetical protein